jgi:hypothetical protein
MRTGEPSRKKYHRQESGTRTRCGQGHLAEHPAGRQRNGFLRWLVRSVTGCRDLLPDESKLVGGAVSALSPEWYASTKPLIDTRAGDVVVDRALGIHPFEGGSGASYPYYLYSASSAAGSMPPMVAEPHLSAARCTVSAQ